MRQGERPFRRRGRPRRLAVPLPAGNGADAAPRGPAAGRAFKHLHFQYASGPEHLFDHDTHALRSPLWYATMCDGDGTLLEQCNIVRALHRLPVWEELPEL